MSTLRRNLLALMLFALLALGLTWPLLPHILSHVPGDGIDDPALAWNLWWVKTSLIDMPAHNPFAGSSLFYPIGINLAFYTLTLLNGLLSIPLQSAVNLILTNNLLLLSSFVLSGFGAYLLARELFWQLGRKTDSNSTYAALLAGIIYAFASAKLFYAALGQFNIASSQWLPFVALYLLRGLRPRIMRPHEGFMLGLFLILQTWAELTYGTFAVLLIALVTIAAALLALKNWEGWRTWWQRTRSPILNAALAAAMFTIALLPYLANMLPDMQVNGDFLVEGGGFSDIFSADVLGFLLPTQLHPWLGKWVQTLSQNASPGDHFMVNKGQHIYPGYTVLLLAALGFWHFRKQWAARGVALLTLFFTWAALGPQIRIHGHNTGIPGLFILLTKIPFFQANRYPSRYSVMIFLGLSLLAALGLWRILARNRPILALALTALILFEHLSIPLPLSDFRPPAIYTTIATDSRSGALLDLPAGWRNGFNVFGKSDVIIMYEQWWQTQHGRPLLGGNTSRNPQQKFQYFIENPVIGVLAALQDDRPIPQEDFERARQLAPDLLRFLNIHTLLVHQDHVPPTFETRLNQLMPLQWQATRQHIARYEASWPAAHPLDLAANDPALVSHLNFGWGMPGTFETRTARWARPASELILPGVTRSTSVTLTLYTPDQQTLHFELDGQTLGHYPLTAGVHQINLTLPPATNTFPRHLRILASNSFPAAGLRIAPRSIGRTGQTSPVNIVARSAGKDVGDFGHIFVDGIDISPNQRGYNLAAIDSTNGQVIATANFDTHDPAQTPAASAAMATWLTQQPPDSIIAGVVRDAAALNLGDDAIAALRTVGVSTDIRGNLRRAHAFVSIAAAAPDTAASVSSDLWPATIVIGDGLTFPQASFALLHLHWQ